MQARSPVSNVTTKQEIRRNVATLRFRRRCEDDIKVDFKEVGCKIVDWNEQVPVRVIVKWILKKWGVRLWTGMSRFQLG